MLLTLINLEPSMHTTYRLNANDLNEDFIRSVKAVFHDKIVEIAICDSLDQEDETQYLCI